MAIDRKAQAQWGRIGGLRLRATHDPQQYTAKARETFWASFERQVDPDGVLDPEERRVRAEAARKAHMLRLSMKGHEARRAKKAAQG